jgi:hypothetical protein
MSNSTQLFRKEIYLSFLLSILLLLSIDIYSYNQIVLGQEDDDNRDSKDNNVREEKEEDDNRDSKDNNVREEKEEEEDFEDASLDELFDNDDNDDDNRDSKDNNVREEKGEEDEVPFILPFKAVPFP